ncbi:MAG: TolC family protein [bacterium]
MRARARVALLALSVSGCVSFTPDGGFASVATATKARSGNDVSWARTDGARDAIAARVAELLRTPLSADDAVQVALLNNRGLQATFYELGISESNLVQAGRMPNPRVSMVRAQRGGEYKIEQSITANVFALITMPKAIAIERRRFAQAQRHVEAEITALAADTRRAYVAAVAAEQGTRYAAQVQDVADAGAELGARLYRVGNWNKLSQSREHAFAADAALARVRADQVSVAAREQLTRLLGLWGEQVAFTLPERLAELPTAPRELPDVESLALAGRLDVQSRRLETEALASNLGLTKTTRFVNVLEMGPTRVREGAKSDPYQHGYAVSLEVPLFDWGGAKVAKAEAVYMQSVNLLAETAINARSEAREAYRSYRLRYDIARRYRDEILPTSKRIGDENLQRYNGMLIGVFELLADARSQVANVSAYIDALRDFWLADARLGQVMTTPLTRNE